MEKVLLTEEEIKTITDIQTQESDLINRFGQLEYQIQSLKLQKQLLTSQITELQSRGQKHQLLPLFRTSHRIRN